MVIAKACWCLQGLLLIAANATVCTFLAFQTLIVASTSVLGMTVATVAMSILVLGHCYIYVLFLRPSCWRLCPGPMTTDNGL